MLRSISRHNRRISVGEAALLAALLAPAFLLVGPTLPASAAPHTQLSALSPSAPYVLIRPSDPCNSAAFPC